MIALAIATASLPPVPVKALADNVVRCVMYSPDGGRSDLTIRLRYERSYDRDGFWWTIDGDAGRYPSNRTARNMYGYDDRTADRSVIYFEQGGQAYVYTLSYRSTGTDDPRLVPATMVVTRRPAQGSADAVDPVGIGFCNPVSEKAS